MTPQQIKDNAPCGATHYLDSNDSYYKLKENNVLLHTDAGWIKSCFEAYELKSCFFQDLTITPTHQG